MIWIKRVGKLLAGLLLTCVFFLLLLYRSDISAEEINDKYQTPQSHFIEVDGVNVHVRFMGEGDPIFFTAWKLFFAPHLGCLAAGAQSVFSDDFLGFSRSWIDWA
ncbi:hypothetical protein [Algoriphagus boritolerans]|uniref:hypothetical protein n=1 Tax=Algoriphagus boritolerans TaxID=308111 RepID=UPI002FCE5589